MVFSSYSEMKSALEFAVSKENKNLYRFVHKGDHIRSTHNSDFQVWRIDDDEYASKFLPNDLEQALEQTYNFFQPTSDGSNPPKNPPDEIIDDDIVPTYISNFSRAILKKIGTCVERSIFMQQKFQDRCDFYLALGSFTHPSVRGMHAFNILVDETDIYVVDVKPHMAEDKGYIPFIVPLKGLDIISGKLDLHESLGDGRAYTITPYASLSGEV